MSEIIELTPQTKRKITQNFLSESNIDKSYIDDFYKCVSHFTNTKSKTLKFDTIMGWCKTEFVQNNNRFIDTYYDLDKVKDQFNPWDGSHNKLTLIIKKSMHDSDSYEHIDTRYSLTISGTDRPYISLFTQFRGKNGFGGTVRQAVRAKADLETGDIFEIIEDDY